MKSYRTTLILAFLFLSALLALWGLERAGTLTERERRERADRVLPTLLGSVETAVNRVEVVRGDETLGFERPEGGSNRWNMIRPKAASADGARIAALVRNMFALKRSPDAGLLDATKSDFGLEHPDATIALFRSGATAPLAVLDLGKVVRGSRYVRAGGAAGADLVDSKLFLGLDDPAYAWRERNVMAVPTFQVATATITAPDETIRLERGPGGRWLMTKPVATLANPAKVESLLAALAALRVEDEAKGYVADDVVDFKPYGLDPPARTVELETTRGGGERLSLAIGKPAPDQPDRVYVRQGGQNDVVLVSAKPLAELPENALAIRSKQAAEVDPKLVSEFEIQAGDQVFTVDAEKDGWRVQKPNPARADAQVVGRFLAAFEKVEASELFPAGVVKNPGVDKPPIRVIIHQKDRSKPVLNLKLGRHDAARRAIYGQLEGDRVVLALSDQILSVLPKNEFAFRDLTIASVTVPDVRRLEIHRRGRVDVLEPKTEGDPNRWLMKKPQPGPADLPSVTRALAALAPIRAAELVTTKPPDLKLLGLDRPQLEVEWDSDGTHRLKVGGKQPRSNSYFAMLDQGPLIFTLDMDSLKPFDAEFHDHVVTSFPAARATRVVLHFAGRSTALRKRPQPKTPNDWVDEPGQDAGGLDLSRVGSIVAAMAKLETLHYLQYDGPIPLATGLFRPRLSVAVYLGDDPKPKRLRIGDSFGDSVFATTAEGDSGPVFVLPGAAWNDLIRGGEKLRPLPADVFAPAR